ncbi:hypothetical protein E4T49_08328 [Aureobasidium sp. EXF-10728]|nr:hypothetical protein E4T49_08328 [Aureobasidium sp. EXF-10728]
MPSFAAFGNAAVRPSILTNMTSGIELEVLAYAPGGIDPRRHLANALRKPVLLECKYCSKLHPWKLPFVGNLDRKIFAKGFSYAGWKITRDQSVRAEQDERDHVPKNSNFFAMEVVSREHHNTITKLLREANVPFWLNKPSRFDDVQSFLETIPNTIDLPFWCPRYLAINLDNLGLKKGKNTVEVRINSGSTDPSEVCASYDFLGKLMLWLSTPGIDHNTVILDIWKNPESTILDLAKQVGASQSTIDYYTDRLTSDWAVRRHSRLISSIDDNDPFEVFKIAIEDNRLRDSRREAVDDKIQQKLEDGHYGQISGSLFKTLPTEIQTHPDGHILNMDGCDYERWADKAIADAEVVYARRLAERSRWLGYVDKTSSDECSDQDYWSSLYFF